MEVMGPSEGIDVHLRSAVAIRDHGCFLLQLDKHIL